MLFDYRTDQEKLLDDIKRLKNRLKSVEEDYRNDPFLDKNEIDCVNNKLNDLIATICNYYFYEFWGGNDANAIDSLNKYTNVEKIISNSVKQRTAELEDKALSEKHKAERLESECEDKNYLITKLQEKINKQNGYIDGLKAGIRDACKND